MDGIYLELENGYSIKSICMDDCEDVFKLCEECSDYYILHGGVIPSMEDAEEIFMMLPPGKGYEDKFVLGILNKDCRIIGLIDIVRGFPSHGECMLGLMIISPKERGRGLGKIVHKTLREWAERLCAESLRIGVIQENSIGIKFWTSLGYRKIKEVEMEYTAKTHKLNVMRLEL